MKKRHRLYTVPSVLYNRSFTRFFYKYLNSLSALKAFITIFQPRFGAHRASGNHPSIQFFHKTHNDFPNFSFSRQE